MLLPPEVEAVIRPHLANGLKIEQRYMFGFEDYSRLAASMRDDGMHFTDRLTGVHLMAQDLKDMGVIRREAQSHSCDWKYSRPIACAFLWETRRRSCLEIGSVWVDKNYRRQGYPYEVIRQAMELDVAKGKDLVMMTLETAIMKPAVQLGFRLITKAVMPYVNKWRKNIGLRDRFPDTARSEELPCPRQGERWLLVKLAQWR
jgi:GNAT superfamily N-acetyltransferase